MVGAVHQRGLVQLARDRGEVPDQQPGRERHDERRVHQHQRPLRVQEPDRADDLEQRDEQQRVGDEVDQEHRGPDHSRAREAQA